MAIRVSFFVICLVALAYCAPNLNWAVDDIIKALNTQLASSKTNETAIENLQYNNSFKLLFYSAQLNVKGTGGKIGDWTTLYREGSVKINQVPDVSLEISGNLGLSDLELTYDSAEIEVPLLSYSGKVTASCRQSAFDLDVTATSEKKGIFSGEQCTATISKGQLTSIGECTVSLDGSGVMQWVKSMYYSFLLNYQLKSDDVVKTLNVKLGNIILDSIKGNVCKYLQTPQ